MPIDSHLPQADPFSLVPTFKLEKNGWPLCVFSLVKFLAFAPNKKRGRNPNWIRFSLKISTLSWSSNVLHPHLYSFFVSVLPHPVHMQLEQLPAPPYANLRLIHLKTNYALLRLRQLYNTLSSLTVIFSSGSEWLKRHIPSVIFLVTQHTSLNKNFKPKPKSSTVKIISNEQWYDQ
jgi:hypothetical protein